MQQVNFSLQRLGLAQNLMLSRFTAAHAARHAIMANAPAVVHLHSKLVNVMEEVWVLLKHVPSYAVLTALTVCLKYGHTLMA
jgi:hypothetical protein